MMTIECAKIVEAHHRASPSRSVAFLLHPITVYKDEENDYYYYDDDDDYYVSALNRRRPRFLSLVLFFSFCLITLQEIGTVWSNEADAQFSSSSLTRSDGK